MRIYLICKRYYTNKDLLQDHFGRLYHLPIELAQNGADVTVDAIDYRNSNREEIHEKRVAFRSVPATFSGLVFLPMRLYRNARAIKPDIIVASGDSHIGFIGMLIARKLGIPFVFDIYDYYPAFRGNILPGMKAMFHHALREADLVLCSNDSLQQKLLPLNPNQLVVENGVDRQLFMPSDKSLARKELGLFKENPLIGYFGSIDKDRGPLLIEACRKLFGEYPRLHLLLAGHVTDVELNDPWIIHYGKLPQYKLPRLINACDLVVLPYAATEQIVLAGACKIAEYLSCGKPVVATRVSCHAQIFEDAPSSLCEPTASSMADSIKLQLRNPEILDFPMHLAWRQIGASLYDGLRLVCKYS